jgi:tetratricopeptide (TPR) repeat protein
VEALIHSLITSQKATKMGTTQCIWRKMNKYFLPQNIVTFFTIFMLPYASMLAEEAQERQLFTSSKALTLASKAELEAAKGKPENVKKAVEIYESIIGDISLKRLPLEVQLPIFFKLCACYSELALFDKEEALLSGLLQDSRLEPYFVDIRVVQAFSFIKQKKLAQAEEILKSERKKELQNLSQKERDALATLVDALCVEYEQILKSADKLFSQKNYQEAKKLYHVLLEAAKENYYPKSKSREQKRELTTKLRYAIALCSLHLADYPSICQVIKVPQPYAYPKSLEELSAKSLFLVGFAEIECGHFANGYLHLSRLLSPEFAACPSIPEEAPILASYACLKTQRLQEAERELESFYLHSKNHKLVSRAHLIEAEIAISLGHMQKAEALLAKEEQNRPETLYQKALFEEARGNFTQASLYAEKALHATQNDPRKKDLALNSAHLLLHLYEELALRSLQKQSLYLEKAEELLVPFLANTELPSYFRERCVLAQAEHYARRITQFGCKDHQKILQLFDQEAKSLSEDTLFTLELIFAKLEPTLDAKRAYLSRLLEEDKIGYTSFQEALFFAALLEFEEARIKMDTGSFEKAMALLEKAKLHGVEKIKIAHTLLKAGHEHNTAHTKALELLNNLKNEAGSEAEATLLLVEAHHKKEPTLAQAIGYEFLQRSPLCRQSFSIMYFLGEIHLAKGEMKTAFDLFLKCLDASCEFATRPNVFYRLAELYDTTFKNEEQARSMRKQLFTQYPHLKLAEDAAFRLFAEKDYQLATASAISHLQEITTLYPNSPYSIAAHFYIGNFFKQEGVKNPESKTTQNTTFLQNAALRYQACDRLFEKLFSSNRIPHSLLERCHEIQIESLLAQSDLAFSNHESCGKEALEKVRELTAPYAERPDLHSLSPHEARLLKAYQEANLLLAKAYEAENNEREARKQLEFCVQWHTLHNKTSKYLAKALLELAKKEQKMNHFEEAIALFSQAEEVDEKLKTENQKELLRELLLEIKIAKSECLIEMEKLDEAMTLASEVINSDTASSLRIKAMLLRADIYELQHRKDLAIKQLEAASQKNSPWAATAKQKLKDLYGNE